MPENNMPENHVWVEAVSRTTWTCSFVICAAVLVGAWGPHVVRAETLTIAASGRPPGLGNPYASMATGGVHPWGYMFDALTTLADNGSVAPGLATRWETQSPTRWRFYLREGVQFANGAPFTAATVAFVIKTLQSPELASLYSANEARAITGVTVVDGHTVDIETRTPDAILDRRLSHVSMVPEGVWTELGPDRFAMAPLGSGPYQLVDWGMKSGRYELKQNPSSWRKTTDVDLIRFQVLPDPTTREQALTSGQVDLAYNVGLDNIKLLTDLGFVVVARERSPVEGIALPNRDPKSPLADVRVRRAMNHAVNRDGMSATLMQNVTKSNAQGVLPDMFGHNPDIVAYAYDRDLALRLMNEAGHAKGFDLALTVRLDGKGPEWAGIYQAVIQDLAAINIRVTLRTVPAQEWLKMWNTGDWKGADMTPFSWTSTYRDAGRAIETVSCAKTGAFFCITEMMDPITAAAQEHDRDKRRAALQQLLAELRDLAPAINLFPQVESVAYSKRIAGLPFEAGYYRIERIKLNQQP
ncbi:MAG: ABC transporter substrate-binding protein [Rhodospirillaceae bacterium]|nr:ABC transporter substrate-binding protein [Rhodospirillaceae bacterium]